MRIVVFILLALAVLCIGRPARAAEPPVRIHLPRTAVVTAEKLHLAMLAIIRCDEPDTRRRILGLPLGRAPWPGEKVVIDRRTILGRLAAVEVPAETVRLTGAAEIEVSRRERRLTADEFLAAATACLEESHPAPEGCTWQVSAAAKGLAVADGGDVKLQAAADKSPAGNRLTVRVAAVEDDKELAAQDVTFRLAYLCKQAVAVEPVAPGVTLTPELVRLETVAKDRRTDMDFINPYGLVSTRPIAPGTVITRAMLRGPNDRTRGEAVIRRNQVVVMRVDHPGFSVRALGQALQDGRVGEYIRVRNVDSKRIVAGCVMADGTVRPGIQGASR